MKELKRQEKEAKKKKRKSGDDGGNEPKRLRVEDYVAATKSLMDSLSQVAPRAPDVPVSRTEFNLLLQMIQKQHEHTVAVHKLVSKSSSSGSAHKPSSTPASYTSYTVESAPPKKSKKKVKPWEDTPPPSPIYTPPSPVDVAQPLTFDEQEALSEAINQLADNLLPGAMQIIREADFVNDDDDEVDLDIDQLDTRTQRKLLCYVMEVSSRLCTAISNYISLVDLCSHSRSWCFTFIECETKEEKETKEETVHHSCFCGCCDCTKSCCPVAIVRRESKHCEAFYFREIVLLARTGRQRQ